MNKPVNFAFRDGFLMLVGCLMILKTSAQSENNISIRKMDEVNTSFVETNAFVTADRTKLYFMSTRGGQAWSTRNYAMRIDGSIEGDADLFYALRENGMWSAPKNAGNICNTSQSEDEPIANLDGELVVFESWRRTWPRTNGPYYRYDAQKGLRGLHPALTRFFISTGFLATDGATLSPDGELFVFAAGEDLDHDMDLYCIRVKEVKANVRKLSLSTDGNERTPFIAADGKTIYFASDGYGGKGGLDVLKATWQNGEFTDITLLEAPVNSEKNDYNFTINATGDWAYMVKNDDLYELDFTRADLKFKPEPVTLIHVPITDCDTKEVIEQKQVIQLYDQMEGTLVTGATDHLNLDSEAKEWIFSPDGYEALVIGSNEAIDAPCLKKRKDIHVYFGNDEYALNNTIALESGFKNAIESDAHILLVGMASSTGSTEYNLKLSEKRANSVKKWLIQHGISGDRIKMVVLGERMSDQGRSKAEDRQVIIKIFKKQGDTP